MIRGVRATAAAGLSVDGVPTGGLLVFANMLSRTIRQLRPAEVLVCWDAGPSAYRRQILPSYKDHRDHGEHPEDDAVLDLARQFLSLAGIGDWRVDGLEADDLIAAAWRVRHDEVAILSNDKDFLQLVDTHTTQIRPGIEADETWDITRICTEYQVQHPAQLALVMALAGDRNDGVPGVPRIGTKTAIKLLSKHGWVLDDAIANEPLLAGQTEAVRRNWRLVALRPPLLGDALELLVPSARWAPVAVGDDGYQALADWLERWQFRQIQQRLLAGSLWRAQTLH